MRHFRGKSKRSDGRGLPWGTRVPRALVLISGVLLTWANCRGETALEVGFAHADITPEVGTPTPVWLAGYYPGRAATGVHDPLFARCVVLRAGTKKLAWIAVDLIGLQFPEVQRLRARLDDFDYVLVASTHNHEGPDVIGVWGPSFLQRGVDDRYVTSVLERMEQVVRRAEQDLRAARAAYGTATDDTLLEDSRLPRVKDGVLRVLRFTAPGDDRVTGLIVQWNCHPEALGADNQQITADFPAATIDALRDRYGCPVVYISGAIGGLLAPPAERIRHEQGHLLRTGDFEFARRYGAEVAQLAIRASDSAQPIRLTPFRVSAALTRVPMTNELYRLARLAGVLRRDGYAWTAEDQPLGEPLRAVPTEATSTIVTEVACLSLGELHIAAIPGELFPELVYGAVEDPAQPGADYPEAPIEPAIANILPHDKWLLCGLANDEIGYIMPRRQWDRLPPYGYGLSAPQYGEINSCGPDVAAAIMRSLQACVAALQPVGAAPACTGKGP